MVSRRAPVLQISKSQNTPPAAPDLRGAAAAAPTATPQRPTCQRSQLPRPDFSFLHCKIWIFMKPASFVTLCILSYAFKDISLRPLPNYQRGPRHKVGRKSLLQSRSHRRLGDAPTSRPLTAPCSANVGAAHALCQARVQGLFTESSRHVPQFPSARGTRTGAQGDRAAGADRACGSDGGPGGAFEGERSGVTVTGTRLYESEVRVLYKVVCRELNPLQSAETERGLREAALRDPRED